jgi:ethanolamine utilization protein EutP (predicted NTPase)
MLTKIQYNLQIGVGCTIDVPVNVIKAMARKMLITVGESTKVFTFDGALAEDVVKKVIDLLHH